MFESLARSWRIDFHKSKALKIPFLFKCWKGLCQPFCFIGIPLHFPGNQKQVAQFAWHLAPFAEQEGKLDVILVSPAQQSLEHLEWWKAASSQHSQTKQESGWTMGRLCGGKWISRMKAGKPSQLSSAEVSFPTSQSHLSKSFRETAISWKALLRKINSGAEIKCFFPCGFLCASISSHASLLLQCLFNHIGSGTA